MVTVKVRLTAGNLHLSSWEFQRQWNLQGTELLLESKPEVLFYFINDDNNYRCRFKILHILTHWPEWLNLLSGIINASLYITYFHVIPPETLVSFHVTCTGTTGDLWPIQRPKTQPLSMTNITFALSLMDPFPRMDIFVKVSSCKRFRELPRGPKSFPTKLNWEKQTNRICNIRIWK